MRAATDRCPGTLRLHEAADGLLARVRLPGGYLNRVQAVALATIADDFGCGTVELTSRANVQVRGLRSDDAGQPAGDLTERLGQRLAEVGLFPSPAHDRVRNIVASPLAGDLRELVAELDAALLARPGLAELPGRFLFGVDGGDGEALALRPDVAILVDRIGETLVHAAGMTLAVPRAGAVSVAMAIAEAFVEARREASDTIEVWRLWELVDPSAVVWTAVARSGIRCRPAEHLPERPAIGQATLPAPGLVVVHVPWGELTSSALVDLLDHAPSAVQLTAWRAVVVRGATDRAALRQWAAETGLDVSEDSPWRWVSACSGRPRCANALADVRADARAALSSTQPGSTQPGSGEPSWSGSVPRARVPVRWSGCERRCGRPAGDVLDVVATGDGYRTERVTA